MSDRIIKFAIITIAEIKSFFYKNPNRVFFEIKTQELNSVDDIKVFIEEWDKRMDFFVAVTPLENGFYKIFADRSIKNKVNTVALQPKFINMNSENEIIIQVKSSSGEILSSEVITDSILEIKHKYFEKASEVLISLDNGPFMDYLLLEVKNKAEENVITEEKVREYISAKGYSVLDYNQNGFYIHFHFRISEEIVGFVDFEQEPQDFNFDNLIRRIDFCIKRRLDLEKEEK